MIDVHVRGRYLTLIDGYKCGFSWVLPEPGMADVCLNQLNQIARCGGNLCKNFKMKELDDFLR